MQPDKPATLRIRFILSTRAGSGRAQHLEEKILRAFAGHDTPDIQLTQYKGHAAELAREWAERWGVEGLVYACGGDGTLNEVATVLQGGSCYMGVLPLGTGNDFARTLYPGTVGDKVADTLLPFTANPILGRLDILKVNEHFSINMISLGFDTVVLKRVNDLRKRWPRLGRLAYGLGVLASLTSLQHYPLRYSFTDAKGEVHSGEEPAAIVTFGNGRYYGSGFQSAPLADPVDGLGDFLLVKHLSFTEFIPLLIKYRSGAHIGDPKALSSRFTKARVESLDGSAFPANYDGEVFDAPVLEVEILPAALPFAYLPFKQVAQE